MIKAKIAGKPAPLKKVIPAIILLSWDCPKCLSDNDLENGVIQSFIFHKKPGHNLILECEWCKKKVIIDYDKVQW